MVIFDVKMENSSVDRSTAKSSEYTRRRRRRRQRTTQTSVCGKQCHAPQDLEVVETVVRRRLQLATGRYVIQILSLVLF